jgi:hypothetical protein
LPRFVITDVAAPAGYHLVTNTGVAEYLQVLLDNITVDIAETPGGVAKINGLEKISQNNLSNEPYGLRRDFKVPAGVELTISKGGSTFENHGEFADKEFDMILDGTLIFDTDAMNASAIEPTGNLKIGEKGGLIADGVDVTVTLTEATDGARLQIGDTAPAKVAAVNGGKLTLKTDANDESVVINGATSTTTQADGIILDGTGSDVKLQDAMDIIDATKRLFEDGYDLAATDDAFAGIDDPKIKVAGSVSLGSVQPAIIKKGGHPTAVIQDDFIIDPLVAVKAPGHPANVTSGNYNPLAFLLDTTTNNNTKYLTLEDTGWIAGTSGPGVVKFNNAEFEYKTNGTAGDGRLNWKIGTAGFHIGFRTDRP